jgi:hypothetical protein
MAHSDYSAPYEVETALAAGWRDGLSALAATCAEPTLGINDAWYLKRAFSDEFSAVRTGVFDVVDGPPEACREAMSAATAPKALDAVDTTVAGLETMVYKIGGRTFTLRRLKKADGTVTVTFGEGDKVLPIQEARETAPSDKYWHQALKALENAGY